jgi:hypothetical protein
VSACDQWIVVTTIQAPSPQLKKLAQIPGWKLVVVGDKKTPPDWHLENCEYLSPQRQLELGYELATLLPWGHYSRKNIGYLYAIEHGAKIIYETDDDNEPLDGLSPLSSITTLPALKSFGHCLNIYSYFGCPEIWPRGFPLNEIVLGQSFTTLPPVPCDIAIEQGIVNGSPDVDAIFRLTQDKCVTFAAKPSCYLQEGVFCPFNSQNTFFHKSAFFTLYLPSHVSMRVSDIWRSYIAQKLIWSLGKHLAFSGPNAVQERNDHVLFHDFLLEQALYLQAPSLLTFLRNWEPANALSISEIMSSLYQALIKEDFFQPEEIYLLDAWLRDLSRVLSY